MPRPAFVYYIYNFVDKVAFYSTGTIDYYSFVDNYCTLMVPSPWDVLIVRAQEAKDVGVIDRRGKVNLGDTEILKLGANQI